MLKHIVKNYLSNFYIAFFIGLSSSSGLAQLKDDAISPNIVAISDRLTGKIELSESEKHWVDAKHKIRFWVSTEAPPYFYDKKKPIGLAIDHAKIVCTVYKKAKPHFLNQCNKLDPSAFKYKVYNIEEVLATIKTKTIVPVFNPVVEFREEAVIEIYIPKVIIDGMKHKTYYVLIHQLYYLNQDVPLDYLYSMLFYVNNIYAKPRMEVKELSRFFTFVISKIIKTGKINVKSKKRWVHWNKENKELTSQEKLKIAKVLTGAFERHTTINKIQEAKKQLELDGKKITNRAIAKLIEMDVSTVGKRIKDEPVDMDYEVSLWN